MPKILVIDNHFHTNVRFQELFPNCDILPIVCDLLPYLDPKVFEAIDLIVLTGGNKLDPVNKIMDDHQGLQFEMKLIQNTNIPVLGICYGHQLIAASFGCEIVSTMPIQRFETIQITNQSLFNINNPIVWENHKYSVKSLSDQMESFAVYSPYNTHEIIKHKTKNVWGLQFHPERDPEKQDGRLIVRAILNQMKLKQIQVIST